MTKAEIAGITGKIVEAMINNGPQRKLIKEEAEKVAEAFKIIFKAVNLPTE